MADPSNKQPAEGSREVIDRELRRQEDKSKQQEEKRAKPEDPAPCRS